MDKRNILARILRKQQTPQEAKMWNYLRNHRYKNLAFKRQHPIGNYIVDFICLEKKLIIEIDGGQHNELENVDVYIMAVNDEKTLFIIPFIVVNINV